MSDICDTAGLCSILIPVYDGERFLKETVESVLAQDYPNIEVVIVDDCSNDSSCKIIEEIAETNPGRVIHTKNDENMGVGNTLRRGLSLTKGKYVVLMGQDDLFAPGFISSQVRALEGSDALAVFGRAEFIDGSSHSAADLGYFHHKRLSTGRHDLFLRLLTGNFLCAPAAVIQNNVNLRRYLGYNNDRLQDFELWLSLLCHGRLEYNDAATLRYRVHGGNFSRPDKRQAQGRYEYYSTLRRVLFSEAFSRFANSYDGAQPFILQVVAQLDQRLTYSKPLLLLISELLEHKLLANELEESEQVKATLGRVYKRMGLLTKSMAVCPHEYPEKLSVIIPDRFTFEGMRRFVESSRALHCIPRSVIHGEVNERYLWLMEGSVFEWMLNDVHALKALNRRRVVLFCRNEEMPMWRHQLPDSPIIDQGSCVTRADVERTERLILSFMEDNTDLYDTNLFSNVPARSGFEEARLKRIQLHNCREQPRMVRLPGNIYDRRNVRIYADGQEIEILNDDEGCFLLAKANGETKEYSMALLDGMDFKSYITVNNMIYSVHGLELDHDVLIGHYYPVGFRIEVGPINKERTDKSSAENVKEMVREQDLDRYANDFVRYLKRKLCIESWEGRAGG